MISRYDYMQPSSVIDEDGLQFPDILSVDYSKIQFEESLPEPTLVSAGDLNKFWLFMYKNYNITELDDLLLNINGIPYIGMLEPGNKIFKISKDDIINFDKNIIPEFKYE